MSPPPPIAIEATTDVHTIQIPDPLTIDNVQALRTRSGKLIAGVAAKSDIELFKGIGRHAHKPKAKRWDHCISIEAYQRKPSSIKEAAKLISRPGMISLGGGLPSPEYFPFDELSYKVPQRGRFSERQMHEDGDIITAGKYDMAEDKSLFDISVAFNYGQGSGSPQLVRWIIEHTEILHQPKYRDWSCSITAGSTSAFEICCRILCNRNTVILSEEYSFATATETAVPLGIKTIGVAMDDEGLLPDSMDRILTNWDPADHNGAQKPHILYTVPSGQNPTGATQSLQRRREVYAVAQKHDLIILEDEPYYFLQMQPYLGADQPIPPPPASHQEFLASLVPSLLSLDTDGRVLRIDSFSKVISPGLRCGWITGPTQLIEQFTRFADQSTQGASGLSQLTLYKLLDEHWGHSGYLDWLIYLRMAYTQRRNIMLQACDEYLPPKLARWKAPMAGMFHWIEIDWRLHPLAHTMDLRDLEDRIWKRIVDEGCLLIKGGFFMVERGEQKSQDEMLFFRATYASASENKISEAVRRFAAALKSEFGLDNEGWDAQKHMTNGLTNGLTNGHV